jgi:competence protein ComFC
VRLVFHLAIARQSSVPSLFRELAGSLFAVAFPGLCSLCGRELTKAGFLGVCQPCWASLEPWQGAACACCGLPFASERALDSAPAQCAWCREETFKFDGARSYGLYAGNLRAAVLQLKFQRRERLGKRLGELLAGVWGSVAEAFPGEVPAVVPVPLHPSRLRERGFNQAELLALGLCQALARTDRAAVPHLETRCLRRTRPTAPQTGLSLRARQENVRGVFSVARPECVRERVVVLVDDVMTTGSTLSACAGALKDVGAWAVFGLTLARAAPEFPFSTTGLPAQAVDGYGLSRP